MKREAQTDLFKDCKDADQGAQKDASGANPSGLNPAAKPDELRDDELPELTIEEAVAVVLAGLRMGAYLADRAEANAVAERRRERCAAMPGGRSIAARAGRGEENTIGEEVAGAVKSMRRTNSAPAPGGIAGMGINDQKRENVVTRGRLRDAEQLHGNVFGPVAGGLEVPGLEGECGAHRSGLHAVAEVLRGKVNAKAVDGCLADGAEVGCIEARLGPVAESPMLVGQLDQPNDLNVDEEADRFYRVDPTDHRKIRLEGSDSLAAKRVGNSHDLHPKAEIPRHRSGPRNHRDPDRDQPAAEERAADIGPSRAVETHSALERASGDDAGEDEERGDHAASDARSSS